MVDVVSDFLVSFIFAFGSFLMISSLCFVVNVVWLMSLVSGVAETLKALISKVSHFAKPHHTHTEGNK